MGKSVNVLLFGDKSTDNINDGQRQNMDESPDEIDSDFEDLLDNDCDFISDIDDDDDVKTSYLSSRTVPPNNSNIGNPPIKLNMSQSTESLFELEIVRSHKKHSLIPSPIDINHININHLKYNYSPKSPQSPSFENRIKPKLSKTQSNSLKKNNDKTPKKKRIKKKDNDNISKHKHCKTLS